MGEVRRFPIRHQGPASGRALATALEQWRPDAIALEGPPEAAALLEWVGHAQLVPPVAMLVSVRDQPERSVAYPLASWSPEWTALSWAARNEVPITLMDMPLTQRLALPSPVTEPHSDAMGVLADLAGHASAEAWWDALMASHHDVFQVFEAVELAIDAAREVEPVQPVDAMREAAMRLAIRRVAKTGAERVAVVCGAWHAPALADLTGVGRDRDQLKGLARVRVDASWIAWTSELLSRRSGYGAGVDSPGWAQVSAAGPQDVAARWVARWSEALRRTGCLASPAQSVDAVRIATALAALRGRRGPGRDDLDDGVEAVFPHDAVASVREWVVMGDAMGRVPDDAPAVPLVRAVRAEQKRLRMPVRSAASELVLDLRSERGRDKSELLHQLDILNTGWGTLQDASEGALGTFREVWSLSWSPRCERALVAASPWGVTARDAAESRQMTRARRGGTVRSLSEHLRRGVLAGLEHGPAALLDAVDAAAAEQVDVLQLLHAAPAVAEASVYGDVRGHRQRLRAVARRLLLRGIAGVVAAAQGIDDDAAAGLVAGIADARRAESVLDDDTVTSQYDALLADLVRTGTTHPRVRGLALRQRLDRGADVDMERALSQALSAPEPMDAALWLEGFLSGNGRVLVHRTPLWAALDVWVTGLSARAFERVLVVLRRTLARLDASVRRDLARALVAGAPAVVSERPWDATRAGPVREAMSAWFGG